MPADKDFYVCKACGHAFSYADFKEAMKPRGGHEDKDLHCPQCGYGDLRKSK